MKDGEQPTKTKTRRNGAPEGDLCRQFYSDYKKWRRLAKHPDAFLIYHNVNEQPRREQDEGLHREIGFELKSKGRVAGIYDYTIHYSHDGRAIKTAYLEMKIGYNDLSDEQQGFKEWCDRWGIPNAVAYTPQEAMAFIDSLQILKIKLDGTGGPMVF